MEWQLVLAIIGAIISGLGVYVKISRERDNDLKALRLEMDTKLAEAITQGDLKRQRIWEKYDAFKKEHLNDMENLRKEHTTNYVSVDLCRLVHANNDRVLSRIDKALETIITQLQALSERVLKKENG